MRLCQQCGVNPIRSASPAAKYCSRACYGLSKRRLGIQRVWHAERVGTLCPVCQRRPITDARARTCGLSCGASSRTDYAAMKAGADRARAIQHERCLERVREFLRAEVAAVAAIGATRPLTQQDFFDFGARVYARSYKRGVWYERERWKSGRARQLERAV